MHSSLQPHKLCPASGLAANTGGLVTISHWARHPRRSWRPHNRFLGKAQKGLDAVEASRATELRLCKASSLDPDGTRGSGALRGTLDLSVPMIF